MMSNDDEDIEPLSWGRVAGATGVQGDLVPRADRARPKYVSKTKGESLTQNWLKNHLGSSDGSGESSAISTSSTILPSPDSQAHDTEDITSQPSLDSRM